MPPKSVRSLNNPKNQSNNSMKPIEISIFIDISIFILKYRKISILYRTWNCSYRPSLVRVIMFYYILDARLANIIQLRPFSRMAKDSKDFKVLFLYYLIWNYTMNTSSLRIYFTLSVITDFPTLLLIGYYAYKGKNISWI